MRSMVEGSFRLNKEFGSHKAHKGHEGSKLSPAPQAILTAAPAPDRCSEGSFALVVAAIPL
jgi:hypothetical protein